MTQLMKMKMKVKELEEKFLNMDNLEYVKAIYHQDTIFACPYNLEEVNDWWIKWNTLYVVVEEDGVAKQFEYGHDYDIDYKRPDDEDFHPSREHSWQVSDAMDMKEKLDYFKVRQEVIEKDEDFEDRVELLGLLVSLITILKGIVEGLYDDKEKVEKPKYDSSCLSANYIN